MAEDKKVVIVREERDDGTVDGLYFRSMVVERDGQAREDGGVPLSISSEAPVQRYDWATDTLYDEVLAHKRDKVDLSWARDGLPLLLEHGGPQIGRVADLTFGSDGKLRGVAVPGNHPDAAWVFADMRSGIRPTVSVGYRAGETFTETRDKNGAVTRVYEGWMPMEVSSVSIPADITVGVGRGRDAGAASGESGGQRTAQAVGEDEMTEAEKQAAEAAEAERTARQAEEVRRSTISAMAEAAGDKVVRSSEVLGWINDPKVSVADVKAKIADARAKADKAVGVRPGEAPAVITDRKGDVPEYSVTRALMLAAGDKGKDYGAEREWQQEFARRGYHASGPNSVYVPWVRDLDKLGSLPTTLRELKAMQTRTTGLMDTTTSGQGVESVYEVNLGFIEQLYNASLCIQLGAQVFSGLSSNVSFVRQTAGATASWTGQAGTIAASNQTLEQLDLSPKEVMARTHITKRLLAQGTPNVEKIVRDDLVAQIALAIDAAAINGSGSTVPTGILQNTSIGSVTMGANGAAVTFAKMVDLQTTVANANAYNGALGYLTNPTQAGTMKQTQMFSTTNGVPIWNGPFVGGTAAGLPAYATKQVPSNLTKGTSTTICSAIICANWNELIIAQFGPGFELTVDPYTIAETGVVRYIALNMADVGLRHVGSFAAIKDAL